MTARQADVRGDNADEIIRLRDALADAEYQRARWVADAAAWERRADALRGLLNGIGVMAANAPEDGDSFGLLEEIAMRIAAADVPDSTPIDEWPDPENPVTAATPGQAAREFSDRITVFPDSGIVELNCFRCPGPSPLDTWQVGYHPSLDVLVEQARAHNAAKHGEPQDARPATELAEVRNALERIVTTYSVRAIHVIAADMLVALSGTSARPEPEPQPAPELDTAD